VSARDAGSARTYGTITVIGGGCYGRYYVRQLERGRAAGAIDWERLVVVDRNGQCAVATEIADRTLTAARAEVVVSEWTPFCGQYLRRGCDDPASVTRDAIVPSPLMPHLMFEWLETRARERFSGWHVEVGAVRELGGVPWQRAGGDGTRYVSYAEWVCPVNCIEPATCPKTKGPRSWTMREPLERYAAQARADGEDLAGPVIFQVTHRAFGVGMFDTIEAVRGDEILARANAAGVATVKVLVGTVSHCHGAVGLLTVARGVAEGGGG